jgi:hypothetical protein
LYPQDRTENIPIDQGNNSKAIVYSADTPQKKHVENPGADERGLGSGFPFFEKAKKTFRTVH